MSDVSADTSPASASAPSPATTLPAPSDWTTVIAPGSKAILTTTAGTQEVTVLDHFYTPAGLHYRLESPTPTVRWTVQADALQPITGVTVTQLYHLMTGELREAA